MTIHHIHYLVLLGNKTEGQFPIIPPIELEHPIFGYFGLLPHSWEHTIYGHSYYKLIANSCETSGYFLQFIYINDIEKALNTIISPQQLYVFLICTEDVLQLKIINEELLKRHQNSHIYLASEEAKKNLNLPNLFTNLSDVFNFIISYANNNGVTALTPSIGVSQKLHDSALMDYWFAPCTVNLKTIKAMLGEFQMEIGLSKEEYFERIAEASKKATSNINGFDRQNNLAQQVSDMRNIEKESIDQELSSDKFVDQYLAPIVLSYPFIGVDFRKTHFNLIANHGGDKKLVSLFKDVFSQEQTVNYCGESLNQKSDSRWSRILQYGLKIIQNRHIFIDFCASLHCSFRFSPYLRLPLIGRSINKELSAVGPDQGTRLVTPTNARKVVRQIQKVGKEMSSKLAPSIVDMFKFQPSQIVAMTDLPIEWMEIEGVPLGFSHDICRVPETPISGLLTHYVINFFTPFTVPCDIIKRTLVVYGCTTPDFKKWQDRVEELKVNLGFTTAKCNTIDEFEKTVSDIKPDFLIIDTHGGVDMTLHQSYLCFGDERLYPSDIVNYGINAKIVFLSACITAPTYNYINTVANAFLEVGAQAVTSSYLPLSIDESSLLYLRLLQLLPIASNDSIHHNWLAFISHVLRTSFIMAPAMGDSTDSELWLNALKSGIINANSMLFANRRKLYDSLMLGTLPDTGFKADYTQIIPHYLLYSTIGRADLIEFESSRSR